VELAVNAAFILRVFLGHFRHLLGNDPLLLRLERGHAVALELLGGPALRSGALVDNISRHDERVLEQAGVGLHASSGEETRAGAEDRTVANVQGVEVELAASVDVADERSVINADAVTEVKKVRLGEVERRRSGSEKGAILANVGTEAAEVHGDPSSTGEETKDTVTSVASAAESLELEEELPALAVRRLVPVVVALLAATHQDPLDSDDHTKSEERLCAHDGDDESAEHGVDDDGTLSRHGENVCSVVVTADKVTKDLDCTNGADVPVDCDSDCDESGVAEDGELAPDVVGSLALVESTTERRG
jgi:hypothetical protein